MPDLSAIDAEAKRQYELGCQLLGFNDLAGARKHFLKAIQITPDAPKPYWGLGQTLFHQEQPDIQEAIQAFGRVVELSPDWSEGHFCLGMAQEKQGQLRQAVHSYELAINLAADDARPRIAMGVCLTQLKDYPKAITELRRGIALKPSYVTSAHFFLADALRKSGQIDAARDEWRLLKRFSGR